MKIPEFPMGRKFYFSMSSRKYIHWEVISLLQSHCFLWLCLNANRKTLRTCLKVRWPPGLLSAHGDATRSWPRVSEYPHVDHFLVMPNWNFPWCNLWLLPLILSNVPPRTAWFYSLCDHTEATEFMDPLSASSGQTNPGSVCPPCRLLITSAVGSRSPKLYTDLHIYSMRGPGDKRSSVWTCSLHFFSLAEQPGLWWVWWHFLALTSTWPHSCLG